MKQVFIYALLDPRKPDEVRYVGKTVKPLHKRLSGHKSRAVLGDDTYRSRWIRKLLSEKLSPEIKLLMTVSMDDWQEWEIKQIAEHRERGHRLTNATIGGDCGAVDWTGEIGRKISASKMGHVVSEETKAKIRAARAKQVITEETRRKIAAASTGRKHSQESREKMKKVQSGRVVSTETRRKISLSKLGHKQTEETRAKRSSSLKGRVFSPETKEKLRLAALRRYGKIV